MANDQQKKLVSFKELKSDLALASRLDEYKKLLNFPPPEKWVKRNPYAGNSKYLPIEKCELLLDTIYQEWKVEILKSEHVLNSFIVTVRLHYLHPVTNQWMFHDGIGADDFQLNSGVTKFSLDEMKSGAIKMSAPKAKSAAISDASHHLGRLFGKDLNRKDIVDFKGQYSQEPTQEAKEEERLILLMEKAKTKETLSAYLKECKTEKLRNKYDELYKKL